MKNNFILLTVLILVGSSTYAYAQSSTDVDARIQKLEGQFQNMQTEIQELKTLVATQNKEKQVLEAKIEKLESEPKTFVDRGMQSGEGFSLNDALGLGGDDEGDSGINIGGEITMRYRENQNTDAGSNGFQFYEIELFIDAILHDNASIYIEYNLLHNGNAEVEDAWIDLHTTDGPLAFAGGTGMKIGNFHYPFGWDNDDEEGYVYGGRTSVNNTLVRAQRIDGWRLRERQIGLAPYYNFDPTRDLNLSTVVGVFNGKGDANNSPAYDNDRAKDFTARVEAKYKDIIFGMSYLYAPYTRNITANANNTAHGRNISRYGVHFKYPDVPFPGQDVSLGGKPWLLWGEYILGSNEGNDNYKSIITGADDTQHMMGAYLEADVALRPNIFGFKPDPMLAFLRYDYYDPNRGISDDDSWAITPGVRMPVWNSSTLVLQYEIYGGGDNASKSITDADRFAAQLTTQF